MKKTSVTLVMLLSTILLTAQAPFPSKEEISEFTKSKTCVVLEDDIFSSYNVFIKDAVKAFWTITPYEFIDINEFNERRKDPAYSFIMLTETNFDKDKSKSRFNFINLLQGKKVGPLGEMPEICAVPLSSAGEEDFDYSYKLGAILSFMQKHARMISEDPSLTGRKYLKYYNIYIPELQSKTILVKQDDLTPEIATIDAIKAICTNDIQIVTEEDIRKAINDKALNTVILHMVGPLNDKIGSYCFKMLIGTDDSNMYYYNQHKISSRMPNGLLETDLRRLAK